MRRMSSWRVLGLCAGACVCLALAACGGDKKPAPLKTRSIDRARASGDRPAAKASGTVREPAAVAIRVSAAPRQRVAVVWALSCTSAKGEKGKTTGGSYGTRSPDIRPVALPRGPTDVCVLDATASILTGRVKATLLAKAP